MIGKTNVYCFVDGKRGYKLCIWGRRNMTDKDIERQIYIKSNTASKDEIRIGAVNL